MQMDAETASLFGSDMGCYKIDFGRQWMTIIQVLLQTL